MEGILRWARRRARSSPDGPAPTIRILRLHKLMILDGLLIMCDTFLNGVEVVDSMARSVRRQAGGGNNEDLVVHLFDED